jgi:hypothetical protein
MYRQHRCAAQPSFWTGQEGGFPVGELAIFAIGELAIFAIGESVMLDGYFQCHVIRAVVGRGTQCDTFYPHPIPARSETHKLSYIDKNETPYPIALNA